MEVILGRFQELPNRNTVVEVSKELSLLQVSKSGELIEIKNQLVIHWEHTDMHLCTLKGEYCYGDTHDACISKGILTAK